MARVSARIAARREPPIPFRKRSASSAGLSSIACIIANAIRSESLIKRRCAESSQIYNGLDQRGPLGVIFARTPSPPSTCADTPSASSPSSLISTPVTDHPTFCGPRRVFTLHCRAASLLPRSELIERCSLLHRRLGMTGGFFTGRCERVASCFLSLRVRLSSKARLLQLDSRIHGTGRPVVATTWAARARPSAKADRLFWVRPVMTNLWPPHLALLSDPKHAPLGHGRCVVEKILVRTSLKHTESL